MTLPPEEHQCGTCRDEGRVCALPAPVPVTALALPYLLCVNVMQTITNISYVNNFYYDKQRLQENIFPF